MTFADECLDRANKATPGPWSNKHKLYGKFSVVAEETHPDGALVLCTMNVNFPELCFNSEFISNSRTDVVELSTRLKKACKEISEASEELYLKGLTGLSRHFDKLVKEIEAPL